MIIVGLMKTLFCTQIITPAIPSAALFETLRMVNRFMNVAYVAWSPALFLLHRLVDWPWELACRCRSSLQGPAGATVAIVATSYSYGIYAVDACICSCPWSGLATRHVNSSVSNVWNVAPVASAFRSLEAMGGMSLNVCVFWVLMIANTSLSVWVRIPGFQISIARTTCHPREARSRLPISFGVFGFVWPEGLASVNLQVEVLRSYSCIMNNNDNHTKPPRTSSSLLIQPFLLRTQQLK